MPPHADRYLPVATQLRLQTALLVCVPCDTHIYTHCPKKARAIGWQGPRTDDKLPPAVSVAYGYRVFCAPVL